VLIECTSYYSTITANNIKSLSNSVAAASKMGKLVGNFLLYDARMIPLFANLIQSNKVVLCSFCRSAVCNLDNRESYVIFKPDLTPIWDKRYSQKQYIISFSFIIALNNDTAMHEFHKHISFDPTQLAEYLTNVKQFNTVKDVIQLMGKYKHSSSRGANLVEAKILVHS
jgi:hypothetical protein